MHAGFGGAHGLAAAHAFCGRQGYRQLYVEKARDGQRQRHKDGGREEHGGLKHGDEDVRREHAAEVLAYDLHAWAVGYAVGLLNI